MVLGNLGLSQEVPDDEVLELTNGVVVRSVLELLEALKTMDDETFSHHVSAHHHDFGEWVFENYHDDSLFIKMMRVHKRQGLIKVLERELKSELRSFTRKRKVGKKADHAISPPRSKRDALRTLGGFDG